MSKTILIAEDEAPMLNALVEVFEDKGFNVLKARDGKKALALLDRNNPDVVLLDILMPKEGGMEVLKELRKRDEGKTPVIMLTNLNPDDEIITGVSDYNPSYYLVKAEVDLEEVVNKVESLLS